jgi:predicted transcriptional regulator
MRTDLNELKTFLKRELESRKKFNQSYSKNAFARDLEIPSTTLNAFLQGERDLSFKNLNAIFKYINLEIHCSFCAKPQKEAEYIIAGPRKLYICGECVDECTKIKKEKRLKI